MSTLVNNIIAINAPKGQIPDFSKTGKTPAGLVEIARFLEACAGGMAPGAPGESLIAIHKGSTNAGAARAYETIALASTLAGTVLDINGASFTAVNGTPTLANGEFDMSGADAAKATSLCAAIMASTQAGAAGDVEACNLVGTAALVSVPAGAVLVLGGRQYKATAYATGRVGEFDVSGSDTADGAALAAAINADTQSKCIATASSGTVTIRQRAGTTGLVLSTIAASITIGGTSGGKLAAASTLVVSARRRGTLGNAIRVTVKGVVASGTVTYSTSSGAQTVLVNGVTVYSGTGASDTANATAAAAAINASTDPLVQPFVRATSKAGVVTVYSKKTGLSGNTILLSATGTGATASGARLTGGTIASGEGTQASGTVTLASSSGTVGATINGVSVTTAFSSSDTVTATALAAAINSSTNALVRGVVTATSSAGVVTINAVKGGVDGNAITLAASGTGATASGTALTGGAAGTTIVPSADHLSGGVGGDDTAPTVFEF